MPPRKERGAKAGRPLPTPLVLKRYQLKQEGAVFSLPSQVGGKLHALARRQLRFSYWRFCVVLILWIVGLLFVQALLDGIFHLPLAVRAIFLAADLACLGGLIVRGLGRIRKGRLNLEQAALLVQKKWPSLRGSLIAAVQFTRDFSAIPKHSAKLVEKLLVQLHPKIERLHFREVIPSRRNWRLTGAAMLAFVTVGMVAYDAMPLTPLLLKRIFLSNAAFPDRTKVLAISRDFVASLGDNIQLEARGLGQVPIRATVLISHENGANEELPVSPQPDRPDFFSTTIHNVQKPFRYRFQIGDGTGEQYRVTTRITPLVRQLECVAVYPVYTRLPSKKLSPEEISVLEGTTLQLRVTASVPLSRATLIFQGWSGQVPLKIDSSDAKVATIQVPVLDDSLTGFSVALVDGSGVASVNDTTNHVEVLADEPPTVRITAPTDESLSVTNRSKLQIAFEVSDNYGLTALTLHLEVTPASSATGEPQPLETKPVVFDLKQLAIAPNATGKVTYDLSVADQAPAWSVGDTVRYWVEAVDNNNETGPGVMRSNVQQLVVVTPEQKRDEILQRLQDDANLMQNVVNDQLEINDQVKASAAPAK